MTLQDPVNEYEWVGLPLPTSAAYSLRNNRVLIVIQNLKYAYLTSLEKDKLFIAK